MTGLLVGLGGLWLVALCLRPLVRRAGEVPPSRWRRRHWAAVAAMTAAWMVAATAAGVLVGGAFNG